MRIDQALQGVRETRQPARRGSSTKVGVAVVLLAIVGSIGYFALKPEAPAGPKAGATSDRAPVTKAAFDITTTASGELEARNQIEIRNKLESEAIITEIVAEGKTVKAGDTIVLFNSEKITDSLNDQQLAVESAKAEFVAAENSYSIQVIENTSKTRQAQLKVDLAELALQQWLEGDVKTKRQKLQTAREKADLELQRLAEKLIQSEKLHEQGFLSKDERDRDEVSYIEACSAWVTADLDAKVYENYEFPKDQKSKLSDVEEAKADLERVNLNNGIELASKDAARSKSRQQLALREQRLAKLKTDLQNCTIKAPSDGLVVFATSLERGRGNMMGGGDGVMQIGRKVYPNELIMILPDTSEMVASVPAKRPASKSTPPAEKPSSAASTPSESSPKPAAGATQTSASTPSRSAWPPKQDTASNPPCAARPNSPSTRSAKPSPSPSRPSSTTAPSTTSTPSPARASSASPFSSGDAPARSPKS
jgi:HlyD family secretion protein